MNTSPNASVSQTIAQIRHYYQARSAQSNTGPYSPYSPYSPYTGQPIVTPPGKSRKKHHQYTKDGMKIDIPVGMMGIQYDHIDIADNVNGGPNDLKSAFQTIYTGEPYPDVPDNDISVYQACNHLHSYGLDFDNSNVWGLTNVDFRVKKPNGKPDIVANRPLRNAKAWANFVRVVSATNTALGGGNLKCLISNRLMWMHLVQKWSLKDLSTYVRQTVARIGRIRPTSSNPDPKKIVAGWYLSDDGLSPRKTNYTTTNFKAVVEAVHTAQKMEGEGVKWPFYFADNIDAKPFWNEAGTQFSIPQKLLDWVGALPDDATPVFMPYYYPWVSHNWNYTVNSPWKKWEMYIEELNKAFFNPDGSAKIHANLKFHPILDAAQKLKYEKEDPEDPNSKIVRTDSDLDPLGHADMHKQIRVVWNLLQKYDSVTGIWFLGWNIDDGVATEKSVAAENWTTNRKWAEAIQNEPHEIEGIPEAIPDTSRIYPGLSEPNTTGKRIPYSLSERKPFEIRIYDGIIERPDTKLVRVLDEGYDGVSPQGIFRNSPYKRHSNEKLRGTSAYWDGKRKPTDKKGVDPDRYYAYLYLDGTRVDGPQIVTIVKGEEEIE